jgi:hypothetical protein
VHATIHVALCWPGENLARCYNKSPWEGGGGGEAGEGGEGGGHVRAPHWKDHAASSRHSKEQQRWKGRTEGAAAWSVGRQHAEKGKPWGGAARRARGAGWRGVEKEASGAAATVHDGRVVNMKSLQHSNSLSRGNCGAAKELSQEENICSGSSRLKKRTASDKGRGEEEGGSG